MRRLINLLKQEPQTANGQALQSGTSPIDSQKHKGNWLNIWAKRTMGQTLWKQMGKETNKSNFFFFKSWYANHPSKWLKNHLKFMSHTEWLQ